MSTYRSFTKIKTLAALVLILVIGGCRQFPGHYVALNSCLQENTSIGEDFLVAFAELEDHLLSEGYLISASRQSYTDLLRDLSTEKRSMSWRATAPHVRDFWGLQQEGTFGAFPVCVQQLSASGAAASAESLNRLASVYEQFYAAGNPSFRNPDMLQALTEAVTDNDFEFLLYRAPLLVFVVYLME